MNLLEVLGKNDALVGELARGLGVGSQDARVGMEALIPALRRGLQRNTRSASGLEGLAQALESGRHERYVERPDLLGQRATLDDGNAILGHILGSKDVSRNVAAHASQQSGLDSELLKKMLPMLAAAVMGSLGQQRQGGGLLEAVLGAGAAPQRREPQSGAGALLEQFLDADRDGSVVDDVLSMAKKFL